MGARNTSLPSPWPVAGDHLVVGYIVKGKTERDGKGHRGIEGTTEVPKV